MKFDIQGIIFRRKGKFVRYDVRVAKRGVDGVKGEVMNMFYLKISHDVAVAGRESMTGCGREEGVEAEVRGSNDLVMDRIIAKIGHFIIAVANPMNLSTLGQQLSIFVKNDARISPNFDCFIITRFLVPKKVW